MPWPGSIGCLLALPHSRAAQALRWGLYGLRASLQAALEEAPGDPGGDSLRELLGELESLLAPRDVAVGPVLPADDPAGRLPRAEIPGRAAAAATAPLVPSPGPRLLGLARVVAEDPRLRLAGKPPVIRTDSDDAIWNDVQRLLLRFPPSLAAEWRRQSVQLAEQAGCRADAARSAVLPLPFEETVYPGLAGAVQASGLRAAPTAPPDPRLAAAADGDIRFLAGLIATYLWFSEQDPGLCHCLKSVFRFGVAPLSGEQRQRYGAELLRLWERVHKGRAGQAGSPSRHEWKERLKEYLDLDEALNALVYQPPAAPDSWWSGLQRQAREVLFRARDRAVQAGCPVHFQTLAGSFAELNRLAPDSLQVDFGVPGEVAVCVRVWARIDGEELKGRVLYRSPQEEA